MFATKNFLVVMYYKYLINNLFKKSLLSKADELC